MVKVSAYADWDKAMKREPTEFRYRSIAGIADPADYEGTGVDPEEGGEFTLAREKSCQRILDYIADHELRAEDVAKITGCPKSLLSHMKNGRRSMCIPARSWESLAYTVMHISVNDLIFGVNQPIVLPRKYALPAAYMMELLSQADAERFATISRKLVDRYYAETPDDCGHHRPITDLVRERMREIKDEHGYYEYQIFGSRDNGTETPNCMKPNLALFWDEEKKPEPKFNFLGYAALYFRDQGMDYLVAEDPLCGFSDVYAVNKNGEKVLLTGPVHQFWRNVLILDAAGKQTLMEMAWGAIYGKLL